MPSTKFPYNSLVCMIAAYPVLFPVHSRSTFYADPNPR